ncbi:aminotransferase class V-fold PLP-dependent enzyme [Enterococcus malodoratus]|uniref:cysteine desulfurase n=1 Tax=Enterococcus malodoratus ATCC 43197 TaxID=1158601 RepID=R2NWD7_9ENTE|nr:aminotransferase class V-fold PLP-dependent enzyme [Enterococcus malodoratus]EOH75333.1 cysteine desulfurase [Enterococcus malodoratus ATCC 43197]EOT66796.1 cysteine desulfurase [Enterococcus malodoratus ATCC 43197]OJG65909.1 cysteine desulfurase [Enterococcus malodoratus]SPW90817.1 cysteine desulfurase [Enterococcus malodoratus]STD69952.1 cysteine desulfurase [Enterococcus malodoratus]
MIYLDNSATTLKKPAVVIEAVTNALSQLGNSGRGVHEDSLKSSEVIFQTRQALCRLFNGEQARQIVFTSGATESLNLAIEGMLFGNDHVITTALEHNSVLRPLYRMQKEKGLMLTIIPADKQGNLDYSDFEAAIKEQTKAIIVTHASNVTGNIVDLEKISGICEKHGLYLIVDASQSAGILSIDVQALKIDLLCFTGHKSLYGPQGTGGLYVRPGISLRPLKVGGSGIDTFNPQHPTSFPTALEAGTLNGHGIAGLGAGVHYLLDQTLEKLSQESGRISKLFYEEVSKIDDLIVYGDFSTNQRCPIVSLNLGQRDSAEISDLLSYEYGIATRSGGHCAPLMHEALGTKEQGVVRFSFSSFTTEHEIWEAIAALQKISQKG